MQYGDEIQVISSGPIIGPKALLPLGIADGSVCWGLWTGGLPTRNPKNHTENWQIPHLIISPIHPDDWPISFHMRVVLRDQSGSLKRFLDSFSKCGVDLHFADCAFAGYDHCVFNAVGQFDDLREWRTHFATHYEQNCSNFNDHWRRLNGSENLTDEQRERPVFSHALRAAIGAEPPSPGNADIGPQRTAQAETIDLMRRHALEWLGRKMLGRMTALWIVIRLREYELYHQAWKEEVTQNKRPANPAEWQPKKATDLELAQNVDPEGDYFFTSKTIQTGRRPWNIELPFGPSWNEAEDAESNKANPKFVEKEWRKYPSILKELEADLEANLKPGQTNWFADGKHLTKELYQKVCNSFDLIHATRDPQNRPRPTREAVLASQHEQPNRWINSVIERVLRHNWILPHSSYALYELTYASIWRRQEKPLEFVYEADRSQLVVRNQDALRSAFSAFRDEAIRLRSEFGDLPFFPRVAIAAFNTKERFVRLRFIRRASSDTQIVSLEVMFRVTRPRREMTAEEERIQGSSAAESNSDTYSPTSRGLLRVLTKAVEEKELNLIRTSSRLRAKYPNSSRSRITEEGTIKMVARLPREFKSGDLARLETYLRNCVNDHQVDVPSRDHITLTVKATPWQITKVFWSSVFTHDRHEEVFGWVREIGKSFGLDIVKSESRINEITKSVCSEIESSDAVLQFVCLRDEDRLHARDSETWQPEYVWLHSEYAMALALGKPIVRVLDLSMPERIRQEFDKVDRDVPIENLDLRCSEETIRKSIESVLNELRIRLSANPVNRSEWDHEFME